MSIFIIIQKLGSFELVLKTVEVIFDAKKDMTFSDTGTVSDVSIKWTKKGVN